MGMPKAKAEKVSAGGKHLPRSVQQAVSVLEDYAIDKDKLKALQRDLKKLESKRDAGREDLTRIEDRIEVVENEIRMVNHKSDQFAEFTKSLLEAE